MPEAKVADITPKSTMKEVLEAYPSAQRALFTRYHIGGCSSCGFSPEQTLEEVLGAKNVLDVQEAIDHIKNGADAETRLQISASDLAALLKQGQVRLVDVRNEPEHKMVHIDGDMLASDDLIEEMMTRWPKDTAVVVYCHLGRSSLDAASYLIGHGFTNVKSLRGGIDAWSQEIDSLLPRY